MISKRLEQDLLINQAINLGYKNNAIIHAYPDFQPLLDQLGTGELEVQENGDLRKYIYPKNQRTNFDHQGFHTIYQKSTNFWVKLIK